LPQWVAENGAEAYVSMLQNIGELVSAQKLSLHTRILPVSELTQKALIEGIASHKGGDSAYGKFRERTVLQFGDEASANEMYFELQAAIRKISADLYMDDELPTPATQMAPKPISAAAPASRAGKLKASERWSDSAALLTELKLEQYIEQFEEEEMTSIELLEEIVSRGDGEKELMDALKEMGIKKMGHRQAIVGAVVGKL